MVACQAPPSMGFSRQEYWSRLPFPSPRLPYATFTMEMVKNHFCDFCSLGQVDRKSGQRIRRLNLLNTLSGGTFAAEVPTTSFGREHGVLSIAAQAWGMEVSGNTSYLESWRTCP